MFMVPRVSTNLYANVSTPTEWVSSYDALIPNSSGPAFSYDQIIDRESGPLVTHMLEGDIDPWMFHQSNLRAYDGMHTLFTDLADRLLAQYQALRVLPIISLSMAEIAARMQDRAALQSAGLVATIGPGRTITLRAASAVRVPVTGARGSNAETYGQVTISMVDVPAGGQISLPLVTAAPAPDGGATPSSAPPSSPGDAAVTATLTTTPTSMSGGGCGCVAAGDLQSSPAAGWWAAALVALLWTARALRPKRRPAIT
jgi:hypothetical protein